MVDLDITQFKSAFGGGVRPNLYKVTINYPTGVEGFSLSGRTAELMVKATQLPSSVIAPVEVPFLGRTLKIPGDRTFPEWTVTVFNQQDFELRNAFENWMNLMNTHRGNVGVVDPTEYFADAIVGQLDRDGKVIKSYFMTDIWPSEISTIELAYDSNNIVEEFTVTFQVHYWTEDAGVTNG